MPGSAIREIKSELSRSELRPDNRSLIERGFRLPTVKDSKILIVDDIPTDRKIIQSFLSAEGFKYFEFAEDGVVALEKAAKFQPDLVILDIVMPRIDGVEVCRQLRGAPETADLPILVQTALDDSGRRADIFRAGASDIIMKPIDRRELLARVAIQLDRRFLIQHLSQYRDRTLAEMRAARAMQSSLLPSGQIEKEIAARYGLKIGSFVDTSSELGGDIWGLLDCGEGQLGIFTVDFAGHGVTAALNTFRLHTLIHEFKNLAVEPDKFISALNTRLALLLGRGQFATMISGVIDLRHNIFRYAAAGSPPPLLRKGAGEQLVTIDSAGVPLGITSDAQYVSTSVDLKTGGMLFFYSDALSDLLGTDGERVGDDRILEAAIRASADTPQDFIDQVCGTFLDDITTPLQDDLTAVCIMRS